MIKRGVILASMGVIALIGSLIAATYLTSFWVLFLAPIPISLSVIAIVSGVFWIAMGAKDIGKGTRLH